MNDAKFVVKTNAFQMPQYIGGFAETASGQAMYLSTSIFDAMRYTETEANEIIEDYGPLFSKSEIVAGGSSGKVKR